MVVSPVVGPIDDNTANRRISFIILPIDAKCAKVCEPLTANNSRSLRTAAPGSWAGPARPAAKRRLGWSKGHLACPCRQRGGADLFQTRIVANWAAGARTDEHTAG
eukprot:2307314-Prymnesium_polylepis.2